MNQEITDLIKQYADVYKKFESFQKGDNSLLAGGDQKTGVIAEYYAKCYIEKTYNVNAEYAKSGESYDLRYQVNHKELIKVQVKAVSSHSKTRIIAPLNLEMKNSNPPFDFLYLISLDENFIPVGFYINKYIDIKNKLEKNNDFRGRIKGSAMKGINKTGSKFYNFENDLLETLLLAIK